MGGSITVSNCEFRNMAPQVRVGPDVQRAVITGNLATGPLDISVPAELIVAHAAAVANNVGTRGCAEALGGLDLCGPRATRASRSGVQGGGTQQLLHLRRNSTY